MRAHDEGGDYPHGSWSVDSYLLTDAAFLSPGLATREPPEPGVLLGRRRARPTQAQADSDVD